MCEGNLWMEGSITDQWNKFLLHTARNLMHTIQNVWFINSCKTRNVHNFQKFLKLETLSNSVPNFFYSLYFSPRSKTSVVTMSNPCCGGSATAQGGCGSGSACRCGTNCRCCADCPGQAAASGSSSCKCGPNCSCNPCRCCPVGSSASGCCGTGCKCNPGTCTCCAAGKTGQGK